MYAKSADEFVLNYKQFEQQANSKESEYLKKNWLNCKEKWVLYYRRDHANTNNHVESINGQLKRHIKLNSKLEDCFSGLFEYMDDANFNSLYQDYINR
jgi:hypothetical protein